MLSVTVSCTDEPGLTEPPAPVEVEPEMGVRQLARGLGPVKSLSVALNDCAVRVCGRNVLRQPVKGRPRRSMPPSMKSRAATVVVVPVILSRHTQPPQGMSMVLTRKVTLPGLAIGS